jgi:excinuclease ABC subunit B
MLASAQAMEFERAAKLRDRIMKLRESRGEEVEPVHNKAMKTRGKRRGNRGKGGAKIPRPKGKG